MKLKIVHGDLFKSKAQVLAHGCNTMGAMGAGIAIQFRIRFPAMFRAYNIYCRGYSQTGPNLEGSCWLWTNGTPAIACLFTQHGWQADLALIETALVALRAQMEAAKFTSLALPAIGCGIAKTSDISIEKVQELVNKVFESSNIETTMYLM